MTLTTFFSGGRIDRSGEIRNDQQALESVWHDPNTRFLTVWQSRCLVEDDAVVLLRLDQLGTEWQLTDSIYLGQSNQRHLFAIELPNELHPNGPAAEAFNNFRALLGAFTEQDAALLAYAKGMVEWHKRHRHCGVCGSPNVSTAGGFVMECSQPECDTRCFPRIDPAIIVLTTHEDSCLLGRQVSWPEGRYSTIAGFVEPGESLEDAVAREVHEETNIQITNAHYLGSQPWPFPNAIMLGFHADAVSSNIRLNDGELADADWFSRDDLTQGQIALPPPQSIAFRLIEHWFDQWDGEPLLSFDLSSDFRKSGSD
jgi:NAD+ diphosphatase